MNAFFSGLLAAQQAVVERSATAGHAVLAEACRAMEAWQKTVEGLYARWAELEGKRRLHDG